MQKIGDSTSTANGAGEFTSGQPGSGIDSTMIMAAWLNAVQRELVNVVLGAGEALNPADDAQVLKAIKTLQELATTWEKISGKPTTIGGYGITDALTKTETGTAIQKAIADLVASSPEALDTLKELAEALGNDPYFATTVMNALAGKAAKATTLAGYGISDAPTTEQMNTALGRKVDSAGGQISGALSVNVTQSLDAPALSINTAATGGSLALLRLRGPNSGILLSHTNGTNNLSILTTTGGTASISAGDVLSSGSICHTATSFMKPVAGQWLSIEGALTLPPGGTWAFQFLNFNNTGSFLGGSRTGLVAGGTQLGASTSVGFAWRIQ
ncbi:hypothetical protein [Pseudomonas sp. EA_65y_Pfl1_P120]|uniref:hypothetical protein n=1 Tax=Pseudomonas sp. EA_65y_Pfl1_P120 TaxID=3088693 RepID=UPI0030DA5876